ncbi:MAG: OsmC family peroxiredoxin [Gammaproteobacteria bacterium]|nr:OsmC family peroxiredoxin [Gammaproteobacteria bacterium]
MQPFPHHYRAKVKSDAGGELSDLTSPGLADHHVAPPAEFGGTGAQWSPETLLTGAVVSCYVLGFRTIAGASKLNWTAVECNVLLTLDRVGHAMRFTVLELDVALVVPDARRAERAVRILEKAKEDCLITNSLSAEVTLRPRIEVRES